MRVERDEGQRARCFNMHGVAQGFDDNQIIETLDINSKETLLNDRWIENDALGPSMTGLTVKATGERT